jgi:hypothetical protein
MINRPILQSMPQLRRSSSHPPAFLTAQTVSVHHTAHDGGQRRRNHHAGGTTFINQGLQGVGRISASTLTPSAKHSVRPRARLPTGSGLALRTRARSTFSLTAATTRP